MKKPIFLLFVTFLILSGCKQTIQPVVDQITGTVALEQKKTADLALAKVKCFELCQQEQVSGEADFAVGSCLSEQIIPDWVCDVAHTPRQPIDDDPRNQCSSFRDGRAKHFVEVDGNCNLIKAE